MVGGGPAGLMAADVLARRGRRVHVFDAMPSVGRKFLLAGRGGLNLTHSESMDKFLMRYGAEREYLAPALLAFDNQAVRDWAMSLGVDTFVGTSGRVFPSSMKAAPLLRSWLNRLRHPECGHAVRFHLRHRWVGWDGDGRMAFQAPAGSVRVRADAVVFALGGGSWPTLGSDGAWFQLLANAGFSLSPLKPSNCGFDVVPEWSSYFSSRYAGQPFKNVHVRVWQVAAASAALDTKELLFSRKGEFVATEMGIEGSLVYAMSSLLRAHVDAYGAAAIELDLLPDISAEDVLVSVQASRGTRSLATHLKTRLGLSGIKLALLHEILGPKGIIDPIALAQGIKALTVRLGRPRPLAEAISSAGGVAFSGLAQSYMVTSHPGIFCAGEMLDWEAPTGGYLLTACLATGRWAGLAADAYLSGRSGE